MSPRKPSQLNIELPDIAVTGLFAVLPNLIALVQSWASRGRGRTVKFKGIGIEFEGSPEELHKLLVALEKGHPRFAGDNTMGAPAPKKKKDK